MLYTRTTISEGQCIRYGQIITSIARIRINGLFTENHTRYCTRFITVYKHKLAKLAGLGNYNFFNVVFFFLRKKIANTYLLLQVTFCCRRHFRDTIKILFWTHKQLNHRWKSNKNVCGTDLTYWNVKSSSHCIAYISCIQIW